MKIYTKTGDKGETGIIGSRVSKSSNIIDAIGHVDELNASFGKVVSIMLLSAHKKDFKNHVDFLKTTQSDLFAIGSLLANAKLDFDLKKEIVSLERKIDELEMGLSPLQNFILPGGSMLAAEIHLTRTICRKAERVVSGLDLNNVLKGQDILIYLNRLSDYLFVLARTVNKIEGFEDELWNL